MLPMLAGAAVKGLARKAIGGIAKSLFSSDEDEDKDKKESKKQENLSSKMSKTLFQSDEEKEEDKKGPEGVLSRIRSKVFGKDGKTDSGSKSGPVVKRESKVVVDAVNSGNRTLEGILSTLEQSLALQQSIVKPSRDELLDKSKGIFKKTKDKKGQIITTEETGGGMTVGKGVAIGAAGLAGAAGLQGFMNADEIFGDEASLQQKISSALGNIVEKATFGLVKNEDIAENIDKFFTTIRTKFNEGVAFLEETMGIKFGSDGEDGFFATMGRKISEGYTAFMNSAPVQSIKKLFTGIFEGDTDKIEEGSKELQQQITDVFEKVFGMIFDAIGKITIPTDAPFFGGRSLGNLMGGKATSKLDIAKEELEGFKEEHNIGFFNPTGKHGAANSPVYQMLEERMEAAEKGEDYQISEDLQKKIDKDTAYRKEHGYPALLPDKVEPEVEVEPTETESLEGIEDQSYGDAARVQALRKRKADRYKQLVANVEKSGTYAATVMRESNQDAANQGYGASEKSTTVINNNSVANNSTTVSSKAKARNTESALERELMKHSTIGLF